MPMSAAYSNSTNFKVTKDIRLINEQSFTISTVPFNRVKLIN